MSNKKLSEKSDYVDLTPLSKRVWRLRILILVTYLLPLLLLMLA
jgi:hypothetical protein